MQHYQAGDLKRWRAELKSLGTSWLCLLSPICEPLPHFFIRALLEAEIEPILIGDSQHLNFPAIDEAGHAQISVDMSQRLMAGYLPDYMFKSHLAP